MPSLTLKKVNPFLVQNWPPYMCVYSIDVRACISTLHFDHPHIRMCRHRHAHIRGRVRFACVCVFCVRPANLRFVFQETVDCGRLDRSDSRQVAHHILCTGRRGRAPMRPLPIRLLWYRIPSTIAIKTHGKTRPSFRFARAREFVCNVHACCAISCVRAHETRACVRWLGGTVCVYAR